MSTNNITDEALSFAGAINIRKLDLIGSNNYRVSVIDQLMGIEVFEDIFSPFVTMTVTIRESLDFLNALPLLGEEILEVELATQIGRAHV